jgi:hypothetical protein
MKNIGTFINDQARKATSAIRGIGLLASGRKVKTFPAKFALAVAKETTGTTKLFEKSLENLKRNFEAGRFNKHDVH